MTNQDRWNPSVSASQPGSQTNLTKEDLRMVIARKFRDEGRSIICASEFDRAVNEAWQKIQQRQTSGQAAPPPYSKLVEQPSTTDNRGFHIPVTAGPETTSDKVVCFFPEEGIDWDVIKEDLHFYLGQDAYVERGDYSGASVYKQGLG
jgi:hypothetical protein